MSLPVLADLCALADLLADLRALVVFRALKGAEDLLCFVRFIFKRFIFKRFAFAPLLNISGGDWAVSGERDCRPARRLRSARRLRPAFRDGASLDNSPSLESDADTDGRDGDRWDERRDEGSRGERRDEGRRDDRRDEDSRDERRDEGSRDERRDEGSGDANGRSRGGEAPALKSEMASAPDEYFVRLVDLRSLRDRLPEEKR